MVTCRLCTCVNKLEISRDFSLLFPLLHQLSHDPVQKKWSRNALFQFLLDEISIKEKSAGSVMQHCRLFRRIWAAASDDPRNGKRSWKTDSNRDRSPPKTHDLPASFFALFLLQLQGASSERLRYFLFQPQVSVERHV